MSWLYVLDISPCFYLSFSLILTETLISLSYNELQETTATVLSAALASKKSEPATSEMPTTASTDGSSSSTAVLADQGSSSTTVVTLPLIEKNGQLQDAVEVAPIMMNETRGHDCKFEVHILACIYQIKCQTNMMQLL